MNSPVPVYRLELYFVLGIVLLGGAALFWHDHNVSVAQQALLDQQKQQVAAQTKAAQEQITQLQSAVVSQSKQIANDEQEHQQLTQTLTALTSQLSTIQAQSRQQIAAVQQMSTDQIVQALAEQLKIQGGVTLNTQTGDATVTPNALKSIETNQVELTSCRAENINLTKQVSTCQQMQADYQDVLAKYSKLVDEQQTEYATLKQSDQARIDLLQKEVTAAKGTKLQRLWNVVKFPVGIGVGVLAHAALGGL